MTIMMLLPTASRRIAPEMKPTAHVSMEADEVDVE